MEKFLDLTESSPTILKAWYISYYQWEEREDDHGKERIRKVTS